MTKQLDYSKERWSPVIGWEGMFEDRYEISDHGRVRSLCSKRAPKPDGIMAIKSNNRGYQYMLLSIPNRFEKPYRHLCIAISRMVANAFIPNPNDYPEIHHKDEQKPNNHYTNLQWCNHDWNVRKSQAYTYKIWHYKEPEKVYQFDSRRQVEIFITEKESLNHQINISYVVKKMQGRPTRYGWCITSEMVRGSETLAQRKKPL
jgi:hypothetical protein